MTLPEPESRSDHYLARMCGEDVPLPDEPQSREETYLLAILGKMDGEGGDIAELQREVQSLQSEMQTAEGAISTNATAISANATAITAQQQALEGLADVVSEQQQALEGLADVVSAQQQALEGLADVVSDNSDAIQANANAIDANTRAVATNADAIAENAAAIAQKQDTLSWDNTPTASSDNPVRSGGIYSALNGKQATLVWDNTPTAGSDNPVRSYGIRSYVDTTADNLEARIINEMFHTAVLAAPDTVSINELFKRWWALTYDPNTMTKAAHVSTWFTAVLYDNRVHGAKLPLYETSDSTFGVLTDDSVGLSCTPSTEETAGRDDFARLPQFWTLEVAAEKAADGSPVFYYIEHIDDLADVRSGEHLCWVLQKNTYYTEYEEDGYLYIKTRCTPATGYTQWQEGSDRAGNTWGFMAHPKYAAGMKDGSITCGTGLPATCFRDHYGLVELWRARGAQYAGGQGNLARFITRMMMLKYASKGNSSIIEGCSNYDLDYTAAVSETNVSRVLVTTAQANNFIVGSAVSVANTARAETGVYARIKSITTEEVSGTTYGVVTLDTDQTFTTTAGTTHIATMPWFSGSTDGVRGYDGAKLTPSQGKCPGLIQRVEFMPGAYIIVADEFLQWSSDAASDGNYYLDIYQCLDQSKISKDTLTSDYVKQNGCTLGFPKADGTSGRWLYNQDLTLQANSGILWPKAVGGTASSTKGLKSALYVYPAASGLRASWCFGLLYVGGLAGAGCRTSAAGVWTRVWTGVGGSPALPG